MTAERQFAADDFLTPYHRRHRFAEAVLDGFKVWPLWPGPGPDLPHHLSDVLAMSACAESISYLDERDADVGFPVGAINGVTILEVSSAEAQEWLDAMGEFDTPRFWAPDARYYLFQHVPTAELTPPEKLIPGLRLLNDGDWIRFPGSITNGQLVHWEYEPHWADPMPLPSDLRVGCAEEKRGNKPDLAENAAGKG